MSEPEEHGERLSPEEQAEYAELLAAYLPPRENVPDEVAARLEHTLDELVVERGREVPVALRPGGDRARAAARRRRLGGALLAAAAVTVGGFAVAPALTGAGGDDAESADTAATDSGGTDSGGTAEGALEDGAGAAPVPASLPRVRADHLEEDVARLVAQGALDTRLQLDGYAEDPTEDGSTGGTEDEAGETAGKATRVPTELADRECLLPPLDRGETWLLVRYAGTPAVLVVEPDDAPPPRTATLLPCAGGPALAEVVLP